MLSDCASSDYLGLSLVVPVASQGRPHSLTPAHWGPRGEILLWLSVELLLGDSSTSWCLCVVYWARRGLWCRDRNVISPRCPALNWQAGSWESEWDNKCDKCHQTRNSLQSSHNIVRCKTTGSMLMIKFGFLEGNPLRTLDIWVFHFLCSSGSGGKWRECQSVGRAASIVTSSLGQDIVIITMTHTSSMQQRYESY